MEQCPICYHELEVRECAPCDDCGWDPRELNHLQQGIHTYTTYEVYPGYRLTLCNFCAVDFGSYRPEHFGFTHGKRIGFRDFEFVKELTDPQMEKDKFCPQCSGRLTFLKFLSEIRNQHSNQKS